jgi:activating signal cointegrator complex subunit 2
MLYLISISYLIINTSLIRNTPRPYDINVIGIDDDVDDNEDVSHVDKLESLLYRRVFMIHWRLIHDTVQKDRVVDSRIGQGKLARDSGLFTIPKLLDLSVLYGYSNTTITRRLLGRIMLLTPELFTDFLLSLKTMGKPLEEITNKIAVIRTGQKKKSVAVVYREISDVVDYLYDITFTLRTFVELLPVAAYAFIQLYRKKEDILSQFVTLYEKVLHDIKMEVDALVQSISTNEDKEISEVISKQSETIFFQIDQIRLNILAIFYTVLNECYLSPILDLSEEENDVVAFYYKHFRPLSITQSEEHMNQVQELYNLTKKLLPGLRDLLFAELVPLLSELLEHSSTSLSLVVDYDRLYNLQQSLQDIGDQEEDKKIKDTCSSLISKLSSLKQKFGLLDEVETEKNTLDEDDAETLSTLKEIFPDHGDGFLLTCLDHYRGNTEKTIDAILNDKLPKYLKKLDKKLAKRKQQTKLNLNTLVKDEPVRDIEHPSTPSATDLVSPTIWEETDFFGPRKINVYMGKKNATKMEDLDTLDAGLQQRILENYLYDDEYDDSYDNVLQIMEDDVQSDNKVLDQLADKSERRDSSHHQQDQPRGRGKPLQKISNPPDQSREQVKSMGRGRGYSKTKTSDTSTGLPGTQPNATTTTSTTVPSEPSPATQTPSTAKQQTSTGTATTPATSNAQKKYQSKSKMFEKKKRKDKADKKRMA